jgi:hypothetical protein
MNEEWFMTKKRYKLIGLNTVAGMKAFLNSWWEGGNLGSPSRFIV